MSSAMMKSRLSPALLAAFAAGCSAALAMGGTAGATGPDLSAGTPAATRWHCAYAPFEGEVILCQLLDAPLEGPPAQALPVAYSRLPRLVADIRNAPQTLDQKTIVIPLHAPPIDMALAGGLARSIMCGSRPDCEVSFVARRAGPVEPTDPAPARVVRRGR